MASSEIKGSRETTDEGKTTSAVRLYVGDAATEPVTVAEFYPGCSLVHEKRCVRVKSTPEIIPGLWLFTIQYQGFVLYS